MRIINWTLAIPLVAGLIVILYNLYIVSHSPFLQPSDTWDSVSVNPTKPHATKGEYEQNQVRKSLAIAVVLVIVIVVVVH